MRDRMTSYSVSLSKYIETLQIPDPVSDAKLQEIDQQIDNGEFKLYEYLQLSNEQLDLANGHCRDLLSNDHFHPANELYITQYKTQLLEQQEQRVKKGEKPLDIQAELDSKRKEYARRKIDWNLKRIISEGVSFEIIYEKQKSGTRISPNRDQASIAATESLNAQINDPLQISSDNDIWVNSVVTYRTWAAAAKVALASYKHQRSQEDPDPAIIQLHLTTYRNAINQMVKAHAEEQHARQNAFGHIVRLPLELTDRQEQERLRRLRILKIVGWVLLGAALAVATVLTLGAAGAIAGGVAAGLATMGGGSVVAGTFTTAIAGGTVGSSILYGLKKLGSAITSGFKRLCCRPSSSPANEDGSHVSLLGSEDSREHNSPSHHSTSGVGMGAIAATLASGGGGVGPGAAAILQAPVAVPSMPLVVAPARAEVQPTAAVGTALTATYVVPTTGL